MLVHFVFKIVVKRPNELRNGQKIMLPINLQSLVKRDCPLLSKMFWPSQFQDDFL